MEASEKISNEATLRDSVTALNTARDRLFADGLDDDEFSTACDEYAEAIAAHDKAVGKFGKSSK